MSVLLSTIAPHSAFIHPRGHIIYMHAAVHVAVVVHVHGAARALVVKLARPVLRIIGSALAAVFAPRRLISVITPTWQRFALLTRRCIPSVRAQDYGGPVDHIIVSDGPDELLSRLGGVRFLPEHVAALNRGIHARRYGVDLARGDLVAYIDDDNAWRPNHLELLVEALERSGADFAYSRALCTEPGGFRWTIGSDPPVHTQIDTSLIVHRRELLGVANWQPTSGPADWDLIERWMRAGATWVHVPVVTLDYYAREIPVASR